MFENYGYGPTQDPSVMRRIQAFQNARQLFPYDKPIAASDLIAAAKEIDAYFYGDQDV